MINKKEEAIIKDISDETQDTKTFYIDADLDYKPGQFFMVSIPGYEEDQKTAERAFSASSSPTEEHLAFTVRKHGRFTEKLFSLKEKDKLNIRGPFGHFTYEEDDKKILLIAGGTGIAPIRSIMKYVKDKKIDTEVKLLYSSKEIHLFYDELKDMGFDTDFTLTKKRWEGRCERFTEEEIKNSTDKDTKVYICGPREMVNCIKDTLTPISYKVYAEGW